MAIFNVNQNRQFYVVKEVITAENTEPTGEGQIKLGKTKDEKQFWFKHIGMGGLTRTDLIDVDKVTRVKLTTKDKMQRKPKKAVVELSEDVNGGTPIVGQDYILRIQINNFMAPGDACVYIKSSAVHATKAMAEDVTKFYKAMVKSLENNFDREYRATGRHLLEFSYDENKNGILIKEVTDQPWRLGVLSQEPVNFEVYATTVKYDGEDVIWAKLTNGRIPVEEDKDAEPVGNGKQVADLEYFCMAERGDMFRNMGWPNNIDVKFMVDSSKEYDMLDIHYYFSGDGVQVHKSEKDITLVTATSAEMTKLKTALTNLGLTVEEKL